MTFTASWIEKATRALQLTKEVNYLTDSERTDFLKSATNSFLKFANAHSWWEHLKVPFVSWQTEHGYEHLTHLAPNPEAQAILIAGLNNPDSEKVIIRCPPIHASALLEDCPGFEYAVVDPLLTWMVIENHHGFLIAVGDSRQRLMQLAGDEARSYGE